LASNRTQLTVEIITDATRAAQGLNETAGKFESFAKKAAVAVAGAFAVDKLLEFGKAAVEAASNLEQAIGGVNLVFGKSAKAITDWAQDTTDNFRVPATAALQFAATMGNALQQAGMSSDQAAEKTKQLAQVGADLASAFGGSTVDALDAVNAAISKGEWERLESFGVTIKASDISAEMDRIAASMGGMSSANEGAIRTQASINLLMKEAAPALGAAASEADTYAAKQEALAEQMDKFKAAVGGPLLGILGSFADLLSGLLPVITPLVAGIAALVAGVADLPAPVLATLAAFAGYMIFTSLAGGVSLLATAMLNIRVALLLASGAAKTFFASIGPIGWAILAVGAAVTIFSMTAKNDIEEVTGQIDELRKAMSDGGLTAAKAKLFEQAKAGGLADALDNVGVSMTTYIQASVGAKGATEQLQSEVNAATSTIFEAGGAFESVGEAAKGAGISQLEFLSAVSSGDLTRLTANMQAYADEQSRLSGNAQTGADIMNSWNAATSSGAASATALMNATSLAAQNQDVLGVELKKAADEQRALGTATGDAAADTLDAAAAQEELKAALKDAQAAAASTAVSTSLTQAKDQADAASRAVSFLEAELGKLDARMSNEAAVVQWARGIDDGTAKLKELTDAGGLNVEALKKWDVAALQVGSSNQQLYDVMSKQADAYPELIGQTFAAAGGAANLEGATKAASEAAGGAYTQFIAMGQAAGLTAEESAALASQLGILDATQISPKLFEVIAQDQAAQATVAQIQATQIGAKSFDITAGADGAYATADDVLTYVDSAGATISVNAATGQATSAVAGWQQATNGTTATTTTKTNVVPGTTAVSGWERAASGTTATAKLDANAQQAQSTLSSTVSAINASSATVRVAADVSSANGSVSSFIAVTNGRSASVTVTANTAPFYAAFNALPTSKTVTLNQVTVSSSAPAPAVAYSIDPAAGTLGRSAPSSRLMATGTTGGGSSVVINVTGAVDPDSTARQIRSILDARDRRSGGVIAL
jgi:hypothetical protein